jgi:putative oxidoreductase
MDTYRRLAGPAPLHTDWGIAVLRVIVGFTFFMHGWQKLFQFGLPGVTNAFTQMGVPLPGVTAPLVSVLELVGGALLILGLLTRPAAILLAIDMLVATLLVHLPAGFFLPNGVAFVLLLLAGAVALVLTGPGAFAVDRIIAGSARLTRANDQQTAGVWTR